MRGNEMTAKFYLDNQMKIHVSLKSGIFYNGYITEISSDFFMLKDDILGEIPVFFIQLKEDGIIPFKER